MNREVSAESPKSLRSLLIAVFRCRINEGYRAASYGCGVIRCPTSTGRSLQQNCL